MRHGENPGLVLKKSRPGFWSNDHVPVKAMLRDILAVTFQGVYNFFFFMNSIYWLSALHWRKYLKDTF